MTPVTHHEVLEAAEHMPLGSVLVVNDFSWDEYELLMQGLDGRHNPRLSYDCGRLEVVSTSSAHDGDAWLIDKVICAYCESRDLSLSGFGHATWKSKRVGKGAEGDLSYYSENAARVMGKRRINLESDPPPDLVVEVDLTTDSMKKLPIYAGLGVAELWRWDGHTYQFFRLTGGNYKETSESRCLPGFTVSLLIDAMEVFRTVGTTEAIKAFRRRVKKLKK